MSALPRYSTTTIGRNKNAPRVWLEGKYLLSAGFTPAKNIEVEFAPNQITITLSPTGPRKISSKKDGRIPVLDLNSAAIAETFGPIETLQVKISDGCITLTPSESQRLRGSRCRNGKEGSVYSGGGLLTQAASQAGYEPAFAIEMDDRYAATFEENHPGARMYNLSVEDVPLDTLPQVELLTLGIPCQPFSRARTKDLGTGAKRDRNLPQEAHPLSDHSVWAALIIQRLNPATIVIEQAPGYLASSAGFMMLYFLQRAGYTVEARVIDPRQYGELTARIRTVIVAHSGTHFEWPQPLHQVRTFGEIRDDESLHENSYFTPDTKPWLTNHWQNQIAKGNGFTSQQLDDTTTSIPCISLRYFSQQGTGVVVKHRTKKDHWRWLSLDEVKKIHGLPSGYILPDAKTTAGEIIGQGVIVTFFEKIIRACKNIAHSVNQPTTINSATITALESTAPDNDQLGLCFA